MKEFLRIFENKNFDGLNFFRNDDGDIEVGGFNFKTFGEKLPGSEMGDLYDIIIYSESALENDPERFKAILISPLEYISRMMNDGFLGIVSKATTTSEDFMNEIFEQLKTVSAEYRQELEKLGDGNV